MKVTVFFWKILIKSHWKLYIKNFVERCYCWKMCSTNIIKPKIIGFVAEMSHNLGLSIRIDCFTWFENIMIIIIASKYVKDIIVFDSCRIGSFWNHCCMFFPGILCTSFVIKMIQIIFNEIDTLFSKLFDSPNLNLLWIISVTICHTNFWNQMTIVKYWFDPTKSSGSSRIRPHMQCTEYRLSNAFFHVRVYKSLYKGKISRTALWNTVDLI